MDFGVENFDLFSLLPYYFKYIMQRYLGNTGSKSFYFPLQSNKSMEMLTKIVGLLPLKSRVISGAEIESSVNKPENNFDVPLVGVNFTEHDKDYSYTMIFHSYLTQTNNDPWKQYLKFNIDR